jgi:hypothetical protein
MGSTESRGEVEFTRTMDPAGAGYFDWEPEGSPISIHMQLDAMDGIARDVLEGFGTLPRRGLEVGGLLVGRVVGGSRPTTWIEGFQPISCAHRFGPQYILDSRDTTALENAAARIFESGGLSVVGFYRSHTRLGFQLEASDFDLIRRYFSDPSDLVLLIKPQSLKNVTGQFFAWNAVSGARPAGQSFPYLDHLRASEPRDASPDTSRTVPAVEKETTTEPVDDERAEAAVAPGEHPRRLVPDFAPSSFAPASLNPSPLENPRTLNGLGGRPGPDPLRWQQGLTEEGGIRERLRKSLPLIAAALLVGGILWFLLAPERHGLSNPAPAETAETGRPLGLYVEPAGQGWHLMWNPNATALRDARSVQLFVREGDDQNRIDLPSPDLLSGSYEYRPERQPGNDVTFRLEVIDRAGKVSAESFRMVRDPNAAAVSSPSASSSVAAPSGSAANAAPAPISGAKRITQPKAVYRAPPVVAAGIRPRINGRIPIDVHVTIDTRGRVLTAVPVTKPHSGLEEYLATRAVQAARLWRFDPARENGKAVQGAQTIHFVFEK